MVSKKVWQLWSLLVEHDKEDNPFIQQGLVWLTTDFLTSYYISKIGKVFAEHYEFTPGVLKQVNDERTKTGVVLMASRRPHLSGLMELIPPPPPLAVECPACAGKHWISYQKVEIPCPHCSGTGWVMREASDE